MEIRTLYFEYPYCILQGMLLVVTGYLRYFSIFVWNKTVGFSATGIPEFYSNVFAI